MIPSRSITDRVVREYADLRRTATRRGSDAAARAIFGSRRGISDDDWYRSTSDRHDEYRRSIEPLDGRVAVICATNRPRLLDDVVANVLRQSHIDRELILVLNADGFEDAAVAGAQATLSDADVRSNVLRRPSSMSLGSCLNAGMASSGARFVAKFDDDDYYGPEYLCDALRAHRYSGAGVVGKHTYFAHIEETDSLMVRFPGHEFSYSGTLAGGTLVIDRDRVGDIQFPDVSIGEDREFLRRCHRRGWSTYSADRFNFVQVRTGTNTWQVSNEWFERQSMRVGSGLLTELVDR